MQQHSGVIWSFVGRRLVGVLATALAAGCRIDAPVTADLQGSARAATLQDTTGATDTASVTAARRLVLSALPNRSARRPLNLASVSKLPTVFLQAKSIVISDPWAVSVNAQGTAIVTNLGISLVTFVDVPSAQVLGTAPVGGAPTDVAFSSNGNTAYVASQASRIDVIDVASRQVTATFAVPGYSPFTVATMPNGSRLFVGSGTGDVLALDPVTGAVVGQTFLGGAINGLTVNPAGTRLYASNYFGGQLIELDPVTLAPLRTFNLGGVTQEIVVSPAGDRVVVASETGFISDVVVSTGVATNVPTPTGAFGLVASPQNFNVVGVTLPGLGAYQAYQPLTRLIRTPYVIGGDLRRAAYHPASRWVIVTNPGLGRVELFR